MSGELPQGVRALIERRNFAHLATLMPDGTPHVTPVWVDHDGHHVLVNTTVGRTKVRNVQRDPRVGLSLHDQENPYSYASIRGRVVEITAEGAEEHIDRLAQKYLGQERYPYRRPGERRVIIKIEPLHIVTWNV